MQKRCPDDAVLTLDDETAPFGNPRVDDALARLTLELGQHSVHRDHHARDHRRDMQVNQLGELVTVPPLEPANYSRHAGTPKSSHEWRAAAGAGHLNGSPPAGRGPVPIPTVASDATNRPFS